MNSCIPSKIDIFTFISGQIVLLSMKLLLTGSIDGKLK